MGAKRKKTPTDSGAEAGGAMLPLLTPRLPTVRDRRGSKDDSLSGMYERIAKGQPERRAFRERRATRRVAVGLPLDAGDGQARRTHDLSTFGLSIAEGPTLPKGTPLALRLFLPDEPETPLKLKGVVVGPFDGAGGVRVKFRGLSMEDVRRIHRLVK